MSLSSAIVARGAAHLRAARFDSLLSRASSVGCSRKVVSFPVRLCPPFRAFPDDWLGGDDLLPERYSFLPADWTRLRLWLSPEQVFSWERFESVLRPLSLCGHRIAFEISGNCEGVAFEVLTHVADLAKVRLAFESVFAHCRLCASSSFFDCDWPCVEALEYFPRGGYDGGLTSHGEFGVPPVATLLTGLAQLPARYFCVYQCVFESSGGCDGWRSNVRALRDLRYLAGLQRNAIASGRALTQSPSVDLRLNSSDAEEKADDDLPLFFTVPRLAVFGADSDVEAVHDTLALFFGHFQHVGQAFDSVSVSDNLPLGAVVEALRFGLTYREGFLVNARELAGLAHCVSCEEIEERRALVETLDPLAVSTSDSGTRIGVANGPGVETDIRVPALVRERGTHVVSSAGMGKSTLLIEMFLQDIEKGGGAIYIDPHGDAVNDILERIPRQEAKRVIHVDPGDADWVPMWNPIQPPAGVDRHRLADDLLSSIERVSRDWGDRLATILRNGLVGLMSLPEATLLDLFNLTRQKSAESDALRRRIVDSCPDPTVRNFWKHDFVRSYRDSDLASARHKLQKLVSGGRFSRMFAQAESRIDFRRCMDEGAVVLVDLSTVGAEAKSILGSFMVTLLLMAAVGRADTPRLKRRSFSIFADEAHLFVNGDAFENLMAQARKFRVNLVIAHQYLKQFRGSQIDALSTAGSTIIGRVDRNDAHFFAKDLQDKVEARDIGALPPHRMIARIGTQIVRFSTLPPREPSGVEREAIIKRSRERYCRREDELESETRPAPGRNDVEAVDPKLLEYDEF